MVPSAVSRKSVPLAAATVFIVDDDAEVRRAVSLLIRSVGLVEHSYASAHEFLKNYDAQAPGCLVLDIRMPGMSGLELQKAGGAALGLPPIIFLTGHGEISIAIQAIRAGAFDFIEKPFSPQALLERILEAIDLDLLNRHKGVLADELQQRVVRLTEREREIMQYLAQGISTKHIAGNLAISPKTVDNHRASILEKMNVDNTTQLAHLIAMH